MGSWEIVLKRTCKWMACPCGKSTNLRNTLGAAYMRDCFRAQAFGERKHGFGARGWTQVYVSRPTLPEWCHESTCRASWCPGHGNLHRHSTPPSRSVQKLADDPSPRCGDNHEGAPAHGRHRHGEWGNSASRGNITRFARTRFADKLNNMLGNAGDDVKARLEKCIECGNQAWMDDTASERKSLIDLLCGIPEDDDTVQENRFPQVVALDNILTAPLEVLLCDRDDDHLSLAYLLHVSCQWVFKQALKTSPGAAVTAGKILEYSYLWACWILMSWRLGFSVKTSSLATFFQKNSKSLRIFFKDDTGASYLVDVGGSSNMSKALKKVHKMNDVLVKEGLREDLQVSELKGVVLLPNIVTIRLENQEISEPITVTGARARMLLGGNQRQQMGETKGAQESGYAYLASF